MLDAFFVRSLKQPLAYMAKLLADAGISADRLTIFGFSLGVLSCLCIAIDYLLMGFCLLILNRIFDGLDGAVARIRGPTERGAFLDITLDFLIYSLVPLAFAIRDPSVALAASFLLFSFVGTGSSFLAFSIFAARHQLENGALKDKSIFYLQGLTEGFETIVVLGFMCLVPQWFELLAWCFGGLCLITTSSRIIYGNRVLRGISTSDPDRLSEIN